LTKDKIFGIDRDKKINVEIDVNPITNIGVNEDYTMAVGTKTDKGPAFLVYKND